MKQLKIFILSWLIHHANREGRNEYFYKIKNRLLSKYGRHIGFDIQFIEGKKCHSCGGTGIYQGYSWRYQDYEDVCYRCHNGWYKRPTWNVLERVQFGKYIFHQPIKQIFKGPESGTQVIEGYIEHKRTRYGKFALNVLFLLYEKSYIKRWYSYQGIGWRCYWWHPRNWIYNFIHFIKKGRHAIPFIRLREKKIAYRQTKPYQYLPGDDLPF